MKRNEKIEKLERLGIFNQWKYNTERANETFNIEFQTVFLFSKSREIKDLLSFLKRFTKKIVTFIKSKPLITRQTGTLAS